MDPLSITANVVAVIQLSDKVIEVCKNYIRSVKSAPNDLRLILVEVGSLKCVLETLELLVSSDENADHSAVVGKLKSSDGPLHGCKHALSRLEQLVSTPTDRQPDGQRRKLVDSLANLAWPLKEGSARKLLDDISRHKATITLFLTTDTIPEIKEIKKSVRKIQNKISDDHRGKILGWLVTTDPSSNHTDACGLHEPETGKWLLRSPDYQNWKGGSNRFLWLHGIPGAGKTVLSSHIIEDVKGHCKSSPTEQYGWTFYYCYFLREQDETTHFLRWILNQLCRQCNHIPEILLEHYNDGIQPSLKILLGALTTLVLRFSRVFVVIDALDESKNRSSILKLLTTIAEDHEFANVNLLVLSRNEIGIGKAIKSISTDISLSNSLVDEDIELYIQKELQDNAKFGRWTPALKSGVAAALTSGANGMFRWVFCQLDALKRLKPGQIPQALKELPQTLDATYERILQNIPINQQSTAHRALQFLAFDFEFNTLDELADAAVVNDDECTFSKDDRFFDPQDLLEISACLITYTKGAEPEIRLAHYTVKEYLLSARVRPISFKISEAMAMTSFVRCSVAYLLTANYDAVKDFPFLPASLTWFTAARFLDETENHLMIRDIVLRLLNPTGAHFDGYMHYWNLHLNGKIYLPKWYYPPGEELAAILGYLCHFELFSLFKHVLCSCSDMRILESRLRQYTRPPHRPFDPVDGRLDSTHPDLEGTQLQIALMELKIPFVAYLIDLGANVNAVVDGGSNLLALALEHHSAQDTYNYVGLASRKTYGLDMLRLLLSAGADPNPFRVALTPLQAAVMDYSNVMLVRKLLEAGADVNAVGDDEAVIERLKHLRRHPTTEKQDSTLEVEINARGLYYPYYATPLQIVKSREYYTNESGTESYKDEERDRAEIEEILTFYGGKSLWLFPVEGLPGYEAAGSETDSDEEHCEVLEQ